MCEMDVLWLFPGLPLFYTVAQIAEFSLVLTMPPIHSGRHKLASVSMGSSEGHFFLPDFSSFFVTSPKKEKFKQRRSSSKDLCISRE